MAGGQERILKRRIKTVQATKKITRAMELIAASRIVESAGAGAAAVPYSEQITEVVKDLAAAGRRARCAAHCSSLGPMSAARPSSCSSPTAGCAAATTPRSCGPPRAR